MSEEYQVGVEVILHIGRNEYEYAYEIVDRHGEHFKLKSKYGTRFCRLWRIKRLATQNEIAVDSWSK